MWLLRGNEIVCQLEGFYCVDMMPVTTDGLQRGLLPLAERFDVLSQKTLRADDEQVIR